MINITQAGKERLFWVTFLTILLLVGRHLAHSVLSERSRAQQDLLIRHVTGDTNLSEGHLTHNSNSKRSGLIRGGNQINTGANSCLAPSYLGSLIRKTRNRKPYLGVLASSD